MQMKLSSLTIFFPCYNDGGTIATMIIRAMQVAATVTDDFEIVVINDGSQDNSALVLDEMARLYAGSVRVMHEPRPSGYGGVLRKGFASAQKDWIFYTDGDAQYDPRELRVLVDGVHDGVDMVNGYKIKRHDPLVRIWVGLAYQYFVKMLFGLVIRDVDCDFRLMRKPIFDVVTLEFAQRYHYVRNGQEDTGRGLLHQGSAGAPLLPAVRALRVLQLPARAANAGRSAGLVVAPRGAEGTPKAAGPRGSPGERFDRLNDGLDLFCLHVRTHRQAENRLSEIFCYGEIAAFASHLCIGF